MGSPSFIWPPASPLTPDTEAPIASIIAQGWTSRDNLPKKTA